jgi:hypothetical protein
MAGKSQVQKNPSAEVSIFDSAAFMFYVVKFGEVLGVDALVGVASKDRTISYG